MRRALSRKCRALFRICRALFNECRALFKGKPIAAGDLSKRPFGRLVFFKEKTSALFQRLAQRLRHVFTYIRGKKETENSCFLAAPRSAFAPLIHLYMCHDVFKRHGAFICDKTNSDVTWRIRLLSCSVAQYLRHICVIIRIS